MSSSSLSLLPRGTPGTSPCPERLHLSSPVLQLAQRADIGLKWVLIQRGQRGLSSAPPSPPHSWAVIWGQSGFLAIYSSFQVLLHYHVPVSGLLNLLCPQVSALSPSPEPGVLSPQAWASACIVLPGCCLADWPPCLSPHFLVIVKPSLIGLHTCLALRASHKPSLVLEISLRE